MLDLVEEPLDQIAIPIDDFVVGDGLRACAIGGHDRLGAHLCDDVAETIGVVALVSEQLVEVESRDQGLGLLDVMHLTCRQNETQGIAERVDDGIDLRAQAAARTPDLLRIAPPFAPAAC